MRNVLMLTVLLAPTVAFAEAVTVADLSWLTGCWAFERDGKRYEEVWLKPLADGAQGMARTTQDGKTLSSEFTRLKINAGGEIHYVANPSGQNEAAFLLVKLVGTKAEFANPAHDFPQRIVYKYTPPDKLDARIEGKVGEEAKSEEYPFRRSACPGNK
jgi:hypothetical protein